MFSFFRNLMRRNRISIKSTSCKLITSEPSYQVFNNTKVTIKNGDCCLKVGEGCLISNSQIRLKGNNNTLIIEDDCIIKNSKIYLTYGNNLTVTIGKGTSIEGAYLLPDHGCSITVGKNCMFSTGIMIRTGDKHPIFDKDTGKKLNHSENISIGQHVWIGRDAVILKGSHINDGSVVGTKAIVTKKFTEKNIILAGAPAKKIKENIAWER